MSFIKIVCVVTFLLFSLCVSSNDEFRDAVTKYNKKDGYNVVGDIFVYLNSGKIYLPKSSFVIYSDEQLSWAKDELNRKIDDLKEMRLKYQILFRHLDVRLEGEIDKKIDPFVIDGDLSIEEFLHLALLKTRILIHNKDGHIGFFKKFQTFKSKELKALWLLSFYELVHNNAIINKSLFFTELNKIYLNSNSSNFELRYILLSLLSRFGDKELWVEFARVNEELKEKKDSDLKSISSVLQIEKVLDNNYSRFLTTNVCLLNYKNKSVKPNKNNETTINCEEFTNFKDLDCYLIFHLN